MAICPPDGEPSPVIPSYTLEPAGRWLEQGTHCFSPFQGPRPDAGDISLLVIHNITLPPGLFGAPYIQQLFLGCVQADFAPLCEVQGLQVSAHLLIRRDGSVVQFVPFDRRAWHAGVSEFDGRPACNDYSIGIELEGTDYTPYNLVQYQALVSVTRALLRQYPLLTKDRVTGHSDIAPGRKTDPGPAFDWSLFHALLDKDS
ncbi:N-acetylmuramyl-L-alanine amidase, negative regulator of AmpC, AmpD [Ferrimonas balearica DSM 9799]|uniref:1,6-anhydro-N-acetylmuramyl-L-alanine amidase AmpD n=1 Tax=Ferrimonas balearica (strain DSM 9799 / CCM 4581 / KCTC 23876 / PAT) TaxID=550540 RepID=E1SN82_FERBD|nr:1,6-anhydro-N-acetylmuramyl-L-alanine amidase AmpD [Ferrimonas balearica]ADN74581.1 N-acetylmuramyl-L-alanine amidase, negative regulator of AmpC, AmpD [Ferrimonas balearica DSM 9799]